MVRLLPISLLLLGILLLLPDPGLEADPGRNPNFIGLPGTRIRLVQIPAGFQVSRSEISRLAFALFLTDEPERAGAYPDQFTRCGRKICPQAGTAGLPVSGVSMPGESSTSRISSAAPKASALAW